MKTIDLALRSLFEAFGKQAEGARFASYVAFFTVTRPTDPLTMQAATTAVLSNWTNLGLPPVGVLSAEVARIDRLRREAKRADVGPGWRPADIEDMRRIRKLYDEGYDFSSVTGRWGPWPQPQAETGGIELTARSTDEGWHLYRAGKLPAGNARIKRLRAAPERNRKTDSHSKAKGGELIHVADAMRGADRNLNPFD